MTTLIDNRLDPALSTELGQHIGLHVGAVLALRGAIPFAVQIEDPYLFWAGDPARYARLPGLYPEVETGGLLLDINVVDRDTWPRGLVTWRLGGFEFARAVSAAGIQGASVVLSELGTLRPSRSECAASGGGHPGRAGRTDSDPERHALLAALGERRPERDYRWSARAADRPVPDGRSGWLTRAATPPEDASGRGRKRPSEHPAPVFMGSGTQRRARMKA